MKSNSSQSILKRKKNKSTDLLAIATQYAEIGADLALEALIEEAKELLGVKIGSGRIKKQIEKLKKIGYQNACKKALYEATLFAQAGKEMMMKVSLQMAKELADKAGITLNSHQIKKIQSIYRSYLQQFDFLYAPLCAAG